MKRLLVLALAMSAMLTVAGFAPEMSQGEAKTEKSATAPVKKIKAVVRAEGDKISFVADQDGKAWDGVNAEAWKGHEGHHVELSAHLYADKGQIHVMRVKMLNDKMSN
jgi:hypothetical protein